MSSPESSSSVPSDATPPSHHPLGQQSNTVSFPRRLQNEHTKAKSINVVLFGETGVGKSSVINLIARENRAKVSSDVNGCTMQSTRHDISFDDMNFAIFDTIGLEEPQMGVNGYLKAIEKAYELILTLGDAGGIHLLLFCMRGGRITATTQSNYRLFCECLCSSNVPVALVFTGLEREVNLDDWWTRNHEHLKQYGIKSKGHACVTAVQDDELKVDPKFEESKDIIRKLLTDCALKTGAYRLDSGPWFVKFGRGLLSFIEKAKVPKKRDLMKVLTRRCKLDPETAKKIAEMIRSSDEQRREETHQIADSSTPAPEKSPKSADTDATSNPKQTPHQQPQAVQQQPPQQPLLQPQQQAQQKLSDGMDDSSEGSERAPQKRTESPRTDSKEKVQHQLSDAMNDSPGESERITSKRTDPPRIEPKEKTHQQPSGGMSDSAGELERTLLKRTDSPRTESVKERNTIRQRLVGANRWFVGRF